jgi:hypothetical protein
MSASIAALTASFSGHLAQQDQCLLNRAVKEMGAGRDVSIPRVRSTMKADAEPYATHLAIGERSYEWCFKRVRQSLVP